MNEAQGQTLSESAVQTLRSKPGDIIGYRKDGRPIHLLGGGSEPAFEGGGGDPSAGNNEPAYSQYLTQFPEDQRPVAEPIFKKWDADVSRMTQGIHQQYQQQLADWEPVLGEYSPQDVQAAIQLATALRDDPESTIPRLLEAYGYEMEGQGADDSGGEGEEDPYSGRFQQLEEAIGTLAEALLQNDTAATEAQEDAELDNVIEEIVEMFDGNLDDKGLDWILQETYRNGGDYEAAAQQYSEWLNSIVSSSNVPAPKILSSSGGIPEDRIDPTKLSSPQARNLVADMLKQANRAG